MSFLKNFFSYDQKPLQPRELQVGYPHMTTLCPQRLPDGPEAQEVSPELQWRPPAQHRPQITETKTQNTHPTRTNSEIKRCCSNWTSACRRMHRGPYLSPCTDQRPQHKARRTEPDRGESGNSLELTSTGDNFLNRAPIAQGLRSTINKWTSWIWKSSVR